MAHFVHKRLVKHKQPKEPIDYLVRFFMIATPLFEIPQAVSIYGLRSAYGVSFLTWLFFACSSGVWLVYGWKQKLRPLVIAYSLYLTIETAIVIGIIMYS